MSESLSQFKNFHEFFGSQAVRYADNACITDGETGKAYTYRQTEDILNKTAALLSALGIKKGDRFGTLARNCPEFLFLYLASMKLGSLIVPLVVDLPAEALAKAAARFELQVLFYGEEGSTIVEEAKKIVPTYLTGSRTIHSLLSDSEPHVLDVRVFNDVSMDDPGSLYFSSGTTGEPKGIPQSPQNLLSAAIALAGVYGFDASDTQMGILPCYHTALATYGFWPSIWLGSNFVLFERFHRQAFWKNLAKHKVSFVEVVPTILTMLLHPAEDVSRDDLSHLKFIGSGSAPLSIALHQKFEDTFRVRVANQYGLSETAPTHFNPPDRQQRKEGSIGKAMSACEAKVADADGKDLPDGEVGEIVMRGPSIVKGYYNDPKATKEGFRDGWFHTGDLASRDKDGFYILAGRKKEMIIRGGAKIYPNEVDSVLMTLAGVKEAATIGVPDPVYDEEVVSYVTLSDGSMVSPEDIMEHAAKYLPAFKCPKKVFFIEHIPQTPSGKIFRRKLVEEYLQNPS